jgi:tetratricopeptide (TPR) repeat protein
LENWKIAYKLKDEISELEQEYNKVRQQKKNALDLGRQMYLLGNYKRTISHLKKQLNSGIKSQDENEESRYLLGRAHEDLGMSENAISYYKSLIKENPPTKWAKKANRRLYVMGKFYTKNKKLSEVAEVNSKYFGDSALIENLKIYEKIERASERLDTDTTLKKTAPQLELGQTVIDTPAQPASPLDGNSLKTPVIEKDSEITEKTKLKAVDKKVKEIFDILKDLRVPEQVVKYEEPVEKKVAIRREDESQSEPQSPKRQLTNPIRSQEIFSVIITRSGELKYAFKNWKKKGLVWGGKISVRMLIASSGAVAEAEIVDSDKGTSHPLFLKELLSKIKKWKFRSMPEDEPMISITFPIIFKTSERRRVKYQP